MTLGREYFRFLAYSSGAFEGMDLTERALLDTIASCHVEQLIVTEAMSFTNLASPATLHRKINNLRVAVWITLDYREGDHRTKYLVLTEKAWAEYIKLNFAVREANNVSK